jgi:hypothetical protein
LRQRDAAEGNTDQRTAKAGAKSLLEREREFPDFENDMPKSLRIFVADFLERLGSVYLLRPSPGMFQGRSKKLTARRFVLNVAPGTAMR